MRALLGSLGLITAVPLTTAIAILFALKTDLLAKWRQILGPEESFEHEGHGYDHWSFETVSEPESHGVPEKSL